MSIEDRAKALRKQLENTDSKFDKEKIEERIAKLTGGVAVLRVGAAHRHDSLRRTRLRAQVSFI